MKLRGLITHEYVYHTRNLPNEDIKCEYCSSIL